MSEFDAFAAEIATEETARKQAPLRETSLGGATTYAPDVSAVPGLPAYKAPAPTEFDGFAEEVAGEENRKVSLALELAAKHDPETYSKAKAIADRDALPMEFALSNLPELEKRQTVSKMRGILEQNEGLREWMKQGDNGALVKFDELDRLSGVSWLMAAGSAKYDEGWRQVRLGELGALALSGKATPEQLAEGQRLNDQPGRDLDTGGFLTGAVPAFAEMLPTMIAGAAAGFEGGVKGAGVGSAIGGGAGALAGGVGAVPGAAAGFGVGFTSGAITGATLKTYELEAGAAYWEFSGLKGEDGKPLDPTAVRVLASVAGLVNAGLEVTSLGVLAKQIPGVKEGTGLFTRSVIKEALKRPGIATMLTNAAKSVAETAGTEVGTEVAQEMVTMLAGDLAKSASDGTLQFQDAGEYATRLAETAKQTLQAMAVMGPLLAIPGMGRDFVAARRGAASQEKAKLLNESAKEFELRERNPAAAKSAVEAATKNAATDRVYVPVERLNEMFQSVNVNPADLQGFEGFGQSYQEAMATGGDVEIRFSDYYTKVAGTPLGEALEKHVRFHPEDMTSAEAKEFNEVWQETRDKLMADDMAALKAEQSRTAPADQVFEDIRSKAIAAGRSADVASQYATVWQAFYQTLAEKTGGDAKALYDERGVEIRFAFPEQLSYNKTDDLDLLLDDLRAGKETAVTRERNKALGPSLSTFLRSKGGLQDSGGELKARDVSGGLKAAKGKGLNLDDAALAAWEAGYFPDAGETRPSIDDLLAALDNELAGQGVYRGGLTPDTVDLQSEYLQRLDTMGRTLSELGLDPAGMSNETIRQELEAVINQAAEQGDLFQSAPATDSAAFKAWFGDSKVVDADGKPLVVYHGAVDGEILAFHPGSHFGTAVQANDRLATIQNVEGRRKEGGLEAERSGDPSIYPAYLRIENPKRVDDLSGHPEIWEKAIEEAKAEGHDGLVYQNWGEFDPDHNGDPRDSYVAFEPTQIKSVNNQGTFDSSDPRILYQSTNADRQAALADKRGSIQFGEGRTIINLFEKADLSTFLHETGHFFLEVTRDMSLREGAPQTLTDDWQTIKDWLGLQSDEVTVDAHEQFARGFEAYLFEGRAPSEGLRGAFSRFRSWLTFIYRKVARLQVNVTPEIKAVFDRMLASEDDIAQADAEYRSIAKTAEEAAALGVDPAWFEKQTQLAREANEQAVSDLQSRMLRDIKRETTREWNENKKAVRAEVMAEFSRMSVYQVTHFLRTGQAISEDVTVPGGRMLLDRAYLVERYGDSVLSRLPRTVPPIYADAKKSVRQDVAIVHPDILAEAFGYESGDALVQDLLSAPPLGNAIVQETELRMRNRFGDLLTEQDRRMDEAVAAVHNDKRAEFLENEMKALYKASRKVLEGRQATGSGPSRQQVAAMARETIAWKKVSDATRVGFYAQQERRLAKEAEKAVSKGDFATAADLKRRQLFSHYLALEARRAKEDAEAATRYLNRFGGRKRPASVDPEYLDQIEAMLERYDLRPSTSQATIAKRKRLAEFIAEKEAAGEAISIPDRLRDEAKQQSYKDLTVEDLRALVDSVKNIEHLGRLKNKLLIKGKLVAFQNVKDELTAAAIANTEARKGIVGFSPTKWEKLNLSVLSAAATMARIEQVVEWLDGGDINGPWRRYVWSPLADAQAREAALRDATMAPLLAVWDGFPKGYLAESYVIQSLGKDEQGRSRSLKKSEIFAMALNTGTVSNMERLFAGEKIRTGTGLDTQEKLDEALSHLTKEDWDAIQKIWDTIDSLWPEASALQKRQTGLASTKIEARSVETPHGTYKGGYYPLVYDTAQTTDPAAVLLNKDELTMDPQHTRLGRSAGHMKERVANFEQPLSVNLDVINRHIEKVIHDITHWEAVKDTNKVLMDPEINVAIRQQLGEPFNGEFKKWLKRNWYGDDLGDNSAFQRILGRVRSNAGIYALAYRWTTVVSQFAGLGPSLARVGARPLASAMKQYWAAGPSNPMEGGERNAVETFVFSKSAEMKNRAETVSREIRLGLAKLEGKSGTLAEAQRVGFMGIAMADRWVSVPTWLAGYNSHIEQFPSDEAGAIENGDRAVRLSQGAGGTKDVSSMQADPQLQLFTMFYGPFNVLFNNLWTMGKDTRSAWRNQSWEQAQSVFWRGMFFVVIPAVMADLLTGKGPEEDDKEEKGAAVAYAEWAAKKVALYPFATIPFLRDAASAFDRDITSDPSPVGRIGNAVVTTAKEIGKGSEANPRVIAKNAVDAAGMAFGLPVGWITTPVNNVIRHYQKGDLQASDFIFSRK